MLFNFKKEPKKIVLKAVHISGVLIEFDLELDEFSTTLKEQREELDSFLKSIGDLLATTQIGEREIFAEFGNHKIRVNDFSSFSISEA